MRDRINGVGGGEGDLQSVSVFPVVIVFIVDSTVPVLTSSLSYDTE